MTRFLLFQSFFFHKNFFLLFCFYFMLINNKKYPAMNKKTTKFYLMECIGLWGCTWEYAGVLIWQSFTNQKWGEKSSSAISYFDRLYFIIHCIFRSWSLFELNMKENEGSNEEEIIIIIISSFFNEKFFLFL